MSNSIAVKTRPKRKNTLAIKKIVGRWQPVRSLSCQLDTSKINGTKT